MCQEIGFFWEGSLVLRSDQVDRQTLVQREEKHSASHPWIIFLYI